MEFFTLLLNTLLLFAKVYYTFMSFNLVTQFVIFNPWKAPWKWITISQNSFVISPALLYHLIRGDTGLLANEIFTLNPIISSKKMFSGLKIRNWTEFVRSYLCIIYCSFIQLKSSPFFYLSSFLLRSLELNSSQKDTLIKGNRPI